MKLFKNKNANIKETVIQPPKIVVLGGGTGSFTLLQGLKRLTPYITAIVNMSDDGGSTGTLRDELGVLPPGDIRQCLVALSDTAAVRDLFSFRFSDGRFAGQSLGNIILSGLELQQGGFEKAVAVASEILHITGEVVPVSLGEHTLVMQDGSKTIRGEYLIGTRTIENRDASVWLEPNVPINPNAARAIFEADMVVLAPGNLYASLLSVLSVDGVASALQQTTATVVSVINLVNKAGQTDDWHVADYISRLEQTTGAGVIDVALYNTEHISKRLLRAYAADGEYPVRTDPEPFRALTTRAVGSRLVSRDIAVQDTADRAIQRTLIRHDTDRVCDELRKIVAERSGL